MITKLLLSLSITLLFLSCNAQESNSKEDIDKSYKDEIERLKSTDEPWLDATLVKVIPKSQEEFMTFFNLDYQQEREAKLFGDLNEVMQDKCSSNEVIRKYYLEMSMYVDGYFAEAYFDFIDYYVAHSKEDFCKIFPQLDKEKRKRIEPYFEDHCK